MSDLRQQILSIMTAGIQAVHPARLMTDNLVLDGNSLKIANTQIDLLLVKRLLVVAVGKAAHAMAYEAEKILGEYISAGVCVCKHGHAGKLERFNTIEAGHPTPDERSVEAATIITSLVTGLQDGDVLIMLISGGASSLVADVPEGCTLPGLQKCFKLLVNSGAVIQEINMVRKHLSSLKGGQLAAKAYPASVYSLIISDVLGDDPATIASGLTAPDKSSYAEAKDILIQYDCWTTIAEEIRSHIENGIGMKIPETAKPGDPVFKKVFNSVIGTNKMALSEAAARATALGYETIIITDSLASNTEVAASNFVELIHNYQGKLPACLLMGGETTIQVKGKGKGGRNQHFVLAALNQWIKQDIIQRKKIALLAVGTDGTDGDTQVAGAVIDSSLLNPEVLDPATVQHYLKEFDSYHFFERHGGLVKTGPTQTNVMDLIIALIED